MDDELIIIDHSKRKKVTYEPWELSLLKLFEDRRAPELPGDLLAEELEEEPDRGLLGAFGAASLLFSSGGVALALMGALIPATGCAVLAAAAIVGLVMG